MKNKQITASVLAIILIAVIVFAVNSCKKKDEIIEGYSAEVFDTYIEIYDGDELIQKEEYPEDKNAEFDIDYAKEHIEFVDVNFDGNEDLCLAINAKKTVISYYCWLYDTESGKFVFSDELSKLKTISLNEEKHQIISVETKKGKDIYVCYEWVDGKLTKVKSIDADSPDVPVEIIEAVENNSVGVKTDDSTENISEMNTSSEKTSQTSTKKNSDSKSTTKSETKQDTTTRTPITTKKSDNKETTKKPQPSVPETQGSKETGVVLVTDSINDGWF